MCAQFSLKTSLKDLLDFFTLEELVEYEQINELLSQQGRVFPYKNTPVLVKPPSDNPRLKLMSYSLVPSWSKTARVKFATYNARIESILEKPTWKKPFLNNHCIIPLTNFYEPVYEGTHSGQMVDFYADKDVLLAAGIYDVWINKDTGEAIESCAILTTEPNKFVSTVGHDRMPILLNPNKYQQWLNPVQQSPERAVKWLLSHQYTGELRVESDRPLKTKS